MNKGKAQGERKHPWKFRVVELPGGDYKIQFKESWWRFWKDKAQYYILPDTYETQTFVTMADALKEIEDKIKRDGYECLDLEVIPRG